MFGGPKLKFAPKNCYLLFSLTESTFRFHTLGVRLCISVASVSYARVVCPSHARHSPISLL